MASAQVLPSCVASSRKQEHLQAGKRRQLEEFHKKKAVDCAKKASSTNASEVNSNEKQPSKTEHARVTNTAGAGTSDGYGSAVADPSSVATNNDNSSTDFVQKSKEVSTHDMHISPLLTKDSLSLDQAQKKATDLGFKTFGDLDFGSSLDVNQSHGRKGNDVPDYRSLGGLPYVTTSECIVLPPHKEAKILVVVK